MSGHLIITVEINNYNKTFSVRYKIISFEQKQLHPASFLRYIFFSKINLLSGKESPSSEPAQESDDSSSTSCASMNTSGGQGPGGGKPSNKKRLSLKDYKLKRMAEKGSTEIGGTPAGSKQPGDQQKNSSHSNRHKSSGNGKKSYIL